MSRYTEALVNLVPLVLGLHDQLKNAVQDNDVETSHGICRIAVAVGETHSRYRQTGRERDRWYVASVICDCACV